MAISLDQIIEQAQQLSISERLRLANTILEGIEPEWNEEIERLWEDEIDRRISKIDAGEAEGRSWEEIQQDFSDRYGK